MAELVRLQIWEELDDTWAWVASGPERKQIVAAGAAEDAPVVDEGAPAVPAPVQAPQPPPTYGRTSQDYGTEVRQDLTEKKSTKLVKYRSSGILCVIVVMLILRGLKKAQVQKISKRNQENEATELLYQG
ncbi:hypothetical protein Tco_0266003 [Tanacetum coccineum]